MKIHTVGAELFYADGQKNGQTDTTNLISAFRKFANAIKYLVLFISRPSISPTYKIVFIIWAPTWRSFDIASV